jgi:hypothetical protein
MQIHNDLKYKFKLKKEPGLFEEVADSRAGAESMR